MKMWKVVFSSAVIVGCVLARPQLGQDLRSSNSATTPVPIVTQYSSNNPDGSFNSSYETGNGIKVQNSGYLKRVTIPRHDENGKVVDEYTQDVVVQTGSYSYTDPEGNSITLTYVADENGFQPAGDHIPKVPQEFTQNRPIQPLNPSNQLGQTITNRPSQPLNQERPIQQFNSNQQFQQFPQQQFSQGRQTRQQLSQDRPIEQNDFQQQQPQEFQQNRPIEQGFQQFPQQDQFNQNRPIQGF